MFVLWCLLVSCLAHVDLSWEGIDAGWENSLPIGNGDLGANLLLENLTSQLRLSLLLSKNDAWDQNHVLSKLAWIEILIPRTAAAFSVNQTLAISKGLYSAQILEERNQMNIDCFVSIDEFVVYCSFRSSVRTSLIVKNKVWRTERKRVDPHFKNQAAGGLDCPDLDLFFEPDAIVDTRSGFQTDGLLSYHRNSYSYFEQTLRHQKLEDFLKTSSRDPFLNRTFGVFVSGSSGFEQRPFENLDLYSLQSSYDLSHIVAISADCRTASDVNEWVGSLVRNSSNVFSELDSALENTKTWWQNLWKQSFIDIQSTEKSRRLGDVDRITRANAFQRYMEACSARGNAPIKFNGLIFTIPVNDNPDYRDWGPMFWWQNSRQPYWSMLSSGDFDLMQPLFKMYFDALPLSRFRTEKYFGHPGASFQETMNFFGLPGNDFLGYGCTDARKNFPFNMMLNPWSRFHYTVNLELLSLMIEYVDFSNDASFSKDILVPFAKDILDFFIHHFGVSKSNTLVISPSQVLESYQDAINPITDIGGIFWNLKRLREIDLISSQVPPELSQAWDDLHRILPNIPVEERSPGSGKVFAPAEARLASRSNIENPELYVVFPFRLFNKFSQVDKELLSQGLDLDMAYRTFAQRRDAHNRGWFPDIVTCALLGLVNETAAMLDERASWRSLGRFPAFWDKTYDYAPEEDHGSTMRMALQYMLLQSDRDGSIILFPTWPSEWDTVEFRLWGPRKTSIHVKCIDGILKTFKVQPENRRKNIRFASSICLPSSL